MDKIIHYYNNMNKLFFLFIYSFILPKSMIYANSESFLKLLWMDWQSLWWGEPSSSQAVEDDCLYWAAPRFLYVRSALIVLQVKAE